MYSQSPFICAYLWWILGPVDSPTTPTNLGAPPQNGPKIENSLILSEIYLQPASKSPFFSPEIMQCGIESHWACL